MYSWSWNSSTLANWCKELTHWKRPRCWERLKAGGEGDDRGWDGWMASLTQWTWVWASFGSRWWIWKPGVLRSMGSQRVRHDWATELRLNVYKRSSCVHSPVFFHVVSLLYFPHSGWVYGGFPPWFSFAFDWWLSDEVGHFYHAYCFFEHLAFVNCLLKSLSVFNRMVFIS